MAREARRLSRKYRLRGALDEDLHSALPWSCELLMARDDWFPNRDMVPVRDLRRPSPFGQMGIDDLSDAGS